MTKIILIKIGFIISFIFLYAAIILIYAHSPAMDYEISIYSALPFSVWFMICFSSFYGIFTLIIGAFYIKLKNLWPFGFIIILFINFIILSLQIFRGYYIYSLNDPLSHLELTKAIVRTGSVDGNFYPISHLLGVISSMLSYVSPNITTKYIPIYLSMLSMVFTYLLALAVSNKKENALIVASACQPLLLSYFHFSLYPHGIALLSLPLIIFIYFKSMDFNQFSFKIILIICIIAFTFIHPVIEIILISCFFIGELSAFFWKIRIEGLKNIGMTLNLTFLSLSLFLFWVFYYANLGSPIKNLINWIIGETSVIVRTNELENIINLDIFEVIELTFRMYGHDIIYLFIAFIACAVIIHDFLKKKLINKNYFIISLMFLSSFLIYFFVAMGTGLMTWGRILGANASIWATPILFSYLSCKYSTKGHINKLLIIFLIFIIISFSTLIGLFSIYRSPSIYQPNWQVRENDICGSNWYNMFGSFNISYAPLGFLFNNNRKIILPNHFGYSSFEYLSEVVPEDTYIVITERFKQATLKIDKWINTPIELARVGFNSSDFNHLEKDKKVYRIYSNRGFEIYYINK